MDLRYINSKGVELNLTQWPYMYSSGDLYDFMWDCNLISGTSNRITEFYKSPVEKPIKISITADTREEFAKAVDHLFETVEVDVINLTPGKLYIGDMYIRCYIRGIKKADFNMGVEFMFSELSVLFENQFWITEVSKSFKPNAGTSSAALDYPHDYPYDYAPQILSENIVNDNYADADFRMTIYGPAVNPSVTIGPNIYKVYTELSETDYLVIDTQERIVAQYDNVGTETKKFNSREKIYEIYAKIPPGIHGVYWPGGYGFDVTMYQKRSEPRWNS